MLNSNRSSLPISLLSPTREDGLATKPRLRHFGIGKEKTSKERLEFSLRTFGALDFRGGDLRLLARRVFGVLALRGGALPRLGRPLE